MNVFSYLITTELELSLPRRHPGAVLSLLLSCLQAQRQDFENSFHACKAFSSLKMAAMKKEQEEKQALEEAQLAVQKGTGPTSAATRKPNKHAKSARKKK